MGYFTKVGSVFYAQLAVPADVQSVIGKRLFRCSLRTGDRREAEKRAMKHVIDWQAQIDAARGQPDVPLEAALKTLDALGYSVVMPGAAEFDRDTGAPLRATTRPEAASTARYAAEMERQFAARREERLLEKMATAGITGPAAEAAAEAATMAEHLERIQVADTVLADLTGAPQPALSAGTRTIDDVVAMWKRERSPSRDAVYSAAFAVRVFKELHGDVQLEAITRRHMAELMQALKDYPKGIPDAERKLPARELIARYKDLPAHRPDLATAGKKFNMIDAAFELALSAGMIETNPAHGLKVGSVDSKKAVVKKRLPFSDDDIVKLFAALDGADQDLRWVAILGLTTGARLNEIVQLRTSDVMQIEGHTCIDIHAEADEHGPRSAKNASSVRKLPLRQEIGAAFAKYAKAKGTGLVFATFQTREGTSAKASKRVMRWVRGSVDDRRKVFHSFRHTLEDVARHCGIPKDMRYRITGHTDSDVGESYGTGYRISAVAEAVAKLRFPVDLEGLVG